MSGKFGDVADKMSGKANAFVDKYTDQGLAIVDKYTDPQFALNAAIAAFKITPLGITINLGLKVVKLTIFAILIVNIILMLIFLAGDLSGWAAIPYILLGVNILGGVVIVHRLITFRI
jgi:hypothetical protein